MFNTLRYVKILEEAGATRVYAETEVQIMAEIIGSNLATKEDIKDLRAEIQLVEARLTIRIGMIVATAVTVLVGLSKLIH